jgi:P27 family predicted phage terminase small subunit
MFDMANEEERLGVRGRELWDSIMGDLEGDVHDAAIVLETCRTLDTIDSLVAAVAEHGVVVSGSRGQVTVNPAVAELRQQQASFARLLGQLNLDEEAMGAVLTARQRAAKTAAQQQWRAKKGRQGGAA